jgi:hypothetical protein
VKPSGIPPIGATDFSPTSLIMLNLLACFEMDWHIRVVIVSVYLSIRSISYCISRDDFLLDVLSKMARIWLILIVIYHSISALWKLCCTLKIYVLMRDFAPADRNCIVMLRFVPCSWWDLLGCYKMW